MTQPRPPTAPSDVALRIRVVFADRGMIGPGKAALLDGIGRTGSIAAAGREMGMSYKRAWDLVGTMNTMFAKPLVESTRGGSGGGGAVLTREGQEVLALFRAFEADAAAAGAPHLAALTGKLAARPDQR